MATDDDGDTISWELPDTSFETDRSDFTINNGVLRFNRSPNYESPHDHNGDNVYKVTVRASDGNDGEDDRNVTITVTDVNERPVVDSQILNQRLTVGSSEGIGLSTRFSDPDDDTLRYTARSSATSIATESVSGSTLTITAVGVGTATVTVTAHDRASGGLSVSQSFTVTVPNRNPTIDPGQSSVSYPENGTGPVATYTAEDPDGGDISWSLPNTSFETDRGDFSIDSNSGELSFDSTPNYESPHDSNSDNVYKVTVRASDPNGGTADRNVTITVTNVNERPVVDSQILNQRLTVDSSEEIGLSTKFSDPDDGDTLRYTARSSATSIATESVSVSTLTITAVGVGTATVTVTAHDRASGGLSVFQRFTVTVPNRIPTIDPGQSSVSYPENGTGPVATYTAEDPDGGDISWSLPNTTFETDRSDFSINADGELSFDSSPNHESPHDSNSDNVYKVTVRASDPNGGTADRNVTITVANVNERPLVATEIEDQTLTVGANRGFLLSNNFSDPDGDTLRYTTSSSATGVATASLRGGTLTIMAAGAGTTMVTVTAHDRAVGVSGGLDVDQDFTVTVPNRPPVVDTEIDDQTLTVGANRGFLLSNNFSDPDGDTLRYTANSSAAGVATVSVRGGTLTIMAAGAGTTMVTVTAHDRAVGVSGGLDVDQDFTVTVELPPLVEVANFTAMPGSAHGEIALDWDPVPGADNYEVGQWQLQPGNLYDYEVLDDSEVTIDLQATSAVVRGLTPSFTYTHSVRAVRGVGSDKVVGDWAVGQDTTAKDETPDTPTGFVVAQQIGGRGISLSWNAATGAADYEAEASSTGGTSPDIVTGLTTGFTGLVPRASYSFRVRSRKPHDGGHLFSNWTEAVRVSAPEPTNSGHQEDHTVAYMVDTIASAPSLPAGVPDPATVISAAIDPAAAAWTNAATSGKNLEICRVGSCVGSNHDGGIVTVKTVAMNTMDTGAPHSDHDKGCGSSVACVKPLVVSSPGPGNHLRDMSLIIEEPAWECRGFNMKTGTCAPHARIYWTDVIGDDLMPVTGRTGSYYYYIDPLMIHEFGHTLGLSDFGNDPTLKNLNAIMENFHANKTITAEDLAQLRAIYAIHNSSSH